MAAAETLARVRSGLAVIWRCFLSRSVAPWGWRRALLVVIELAHKISKSAICRLGGGVFARGGLAGLGPEPWACCGRCACCGGG